MSSRDELGRARCWSCRCRARRKQELDTLSTELTAIVAELEPGVSPTLVGEAVAIAATTTAQHRQLYTHLSTNPNALISAESGAPPVVTRFIKALIEAGATNVREPRCARCGEPKALIKVMDQGRICDPCWQTLRMTACGACGNVRRIKSRGSNGEPICDSCHHRDQTRWEDCSKCGRSRPVHTRREGRPLCGGCSQRKLRCDACGELAPIHSRRSGIRLCAHCYERPRRACGLCGRVGAISARATNDQPDLCRSCYRMPKAVCVLCEKQAPCRYVKAGTPTCMRCLLDRTLTGLFTVDGEMPPWLARIKEALLSFKDPETARVWLSRSRGAEALVRLAKGELPLTHEALDELGPSRSIDHVRGLLMMSGGLPERDEFIARLEASAAELLQAVDNDGDRQLLREFTRWRLLRRLRGRSERGKATAHSVRNARRKIIETARFLAWLRHQDVAVNDCSQTHVDLWLASGGLTRRYIRDFVTWAHERRLLAALTVPVLGGTSQPTAPVDAEKRWADARRILHDDEMDISDRVAAALVLLYAQLPSRVVRLKRSDVSVLKGIVFITFGGDKVEIPEPLGTLVTQLPQHRFEGPSAQLSHPTPWLFPGRRAGHPMTPAQLCERFNAIGIDMRASRNAALLQLASEVPASVLADLLNISVTTATKWVRVAGGDWGRYAAIRSQLSTSP